MLAFPTTHLVKTMPSSPAGNAIMTIGEVADYLKVTERTIYRLAGAKQIPAFKVGGRSNLASFQRAIWNIKTNHCRKVIGIPVLSVRHHHHPANTT